MSNFGPPGGPPDPFDGRPGGGHPPADPHRAWGEPPADQRYAPTTRGYEPPIQRYAPAASWETGRSGPPAYPPAPWEAGQPAPTAFPPTGPGHDGPPYPEPPRPGRGRGRLIAVLAVVGVLLLVAGAAFWAFGRDEPAPAGAPSAAAVDPSASEPSAPATTAAAPASSTDPRFVRVGQCVRNDGGVAEPRLVITECGAKAYEVLSRVEGPTSGKKDAEAKCAKVAGYTDWFFYDSELDTLDFVLCLKRR